MTERVDIAAPLREICDRLGLVYENVASLFITPSSAVARIFLLDATGHKYVDETGEAAMEPRRFELAIKTAGPTSEPIVVEAGGECQVVLWSSRVCERGTRGCVAGHQTRGGVDVGPTSEAKDE